MPHTPTSSTKRAPSSTSRKEKPGLPESLEVRIRSHALGHRIEMIGNTGWIPIFPEMTVRPCSCLSVALR